LAAGMHSHTVVTDLPELAVDDITPLALFLFSFRFPPSSFTR
jgi:hypothetical protein